MNVPSTNGSEYYRKKINYYNFGITDRNSWILFLLQFSQYAIRHKGLFEICYKDNPYEENKYFAPAVDSKFTY